MKIRICCWITTLLLILGMITTGCAPAVTEPADESGGKTEWRLPKASVELPAEFADKTIQETHLQLDLYYAPTMDNVRSQAECVVQGSVKGYSYVTAGDTTTGKLPWTIIHLENVRLLSGEATISSGGTLDIYTYGGYVSLRDHLGDSLEAHGQTKTDEELDSTVLHVTYDGSELPVVGEEYAFYLVWRTAGEPINCYELLNGAYGQFYAEDGQYVRQNCEAEGEGAQVYTKEQILLD